MIQQCRCVKCCLLAFMSAVFALGFFVVEPKACDIAVVSSDASSTGRPMIMKVRDNSLSWEQEVSSYKRAYNTDNPDAGGSIRVIDRTRVIPAQSGGVNEAGFAITNTTVYQDSPIHEYLASANLNLMSNALTHCVTVSDFDEYVAGWHLISSNSSRILSGNFVAIDASGGAALYEIVTGDSDTDINAYGGRPKVHRIDANTGFVTNEDGTLVGNNGEIGIITDYRKKITIQIMNEDREIINTEYRLSSDGTKIVNSRGITVDNGSRFCGIVNRTNSNFWVHLNDDTPRQDRALDLLLKLKENGELNYRTILRDVTRDISIDEYGLATYPSLSNLDEGTDTQQSTFHTINRYCTTLAFVVDGVEPGDNPDLSTLWVNLGEPALGVSVPCFPAANSVPDYLWADKAVSGLINSYNLDLESTCFINQMFYDRQSTLYDVSPSASTGDLLSLVSVDILVELLKYDLMLRTSTAEEWAEYEGDLIEWHEEFLAELSASDTSDKTIDLPGLYAIQAWSFPLEDKIFDKADAYLDAMRQDSAKISQDNLSDFSDYCSEFMYDNYSEGSSTYSEWTFEEPWDTGKGSSTNATSLLSLLFWWLK